MATLIKGVVMGFFSPSNSLQSYWP